VRGGSAVTMSAFDEMGERGAPRPAYAGVAEWLATMPTEILAAKRDEAELIFRRTGITFAVYTEGGDPERLIPFDIIPRILDAREWSVLERGLAQRVRALNAFIADVYGPQDFIRDGRIPPALVLHNPGFAAEMVGLKVPAGVYTHIAGIDM